MPKRQGQHPDGVEPAPLGPQGLSGGRAQSSGRARSDTATLEMEPRLRPSRPALGAMLGAQLDLKLPRRRGPPAIFSVAWFVVAFVAPVLLGLIYYGLVASKQYVVDFHFTVRAPLPDAAQANNETSNSAVALLGRSVPTVSSTGSVDTLENYTIVDYVRSDQAARDLDQRLNLKSMFSQAGADPLSRYGGDPHAETLAKYWRRMVWANYDPATGLAEVKVRAFRPADAYAIATNLLDLADGVVNTSGRRSRADSLRVAQQQVDTAQSRMTEIRNRLTALRNQIGSIDPTKDENVGNVALSNTLRQELTQLESQLAFLSSQIHSPDAPQIVKTKAEIAATQRQLAGVDARVNRTQSGNVALTTAVGEYEQLTAEEQAAEQLLFQSLGQLQQASVQADSQRLYMSTYVRPASPESSTYPERLNSILIIALVSALIWLLGALVGKSIMDHVR